MSNADGNLSFFCFMEEINSDEAVNSEHHPLVRCVGFTVTQTVRTYQ